MGKSAKSTATVEIEIQIERWRLRPHGIDAERHVEGEKIEKHTTLDNSAAALVSRVARAYNPFPGEGAIPTLCSTRRR